MVSRAHHLATVVRWVLKSTATQCLRLIFLFDLNEEVLFDLGFNFPDLVLEKNANDAVIFWTEKSYVLKEKCMFGVCSGKEVAMFWKEGVCVLEKR